MWIDFLIFSEKFTLEENYRVEVLFSRSLPVSLFSHFHWLPLTSPVRAAPLMWVLSLTVDNRASL